MKYFSFVQAVRQSQRDTDHFKYTYRTNQVQYMEGKTGGFYFGISDRVKQTPAIFDYEKLEMLIMAATLGKGIK